MYSFKYKQLEMFNYIFMKTYHLYVLLYWVFLIKIIKKKNIGIESLMICDVYTFQYKQVYHKYVRRWS